ncbi:MAG: translation initiation factor IF-3 [Candidatus Obscuribacterales bacterium]|nr:translation initiation factor IF-3 [Candidatus Obscuribacterales bacterium]
MIRVIDEHGDIIGTMPKKEALRLARALGLDLVLIAPDAYPPVCQLMDYQKFKAIQEATNRDIERKHHLTNFQEIKLRYHLEEPEYQAKLKTLIRHLQVGDKVKLLMILRGAQMKKKDEALALFQRIIEDAGSFAVVSRAPALTGKSLIALLSPDIKTIRKGLYRSLHQQ